MKKYPFITFPKREWKIIKTTSNKGETCSTVRCCKELGKYKTNNIYKTPWGDLIKITKIKRYYKPEDIPTWKFFDKEMKISVSKGKPYGGGKWDHVYFKKI